MSDDRPAPSPDVENLLGAVDAVIAIHDKPNTHDGAYMPMCWECGSQKPCSTLSLLSFFRGFVRAPEETDRAE